MIDRQHTLNIHTRRDGATVNGDCSCTLWSIRNVDLKAARAAHGEHLQAELGPDAQNAREGVV